MPHVELKRMTQSSLAKALIDNAADPRVMLRGLERRLDEIVAIASDPEAYKKPLQRAIQAVRAELRGNHAL
jgi:hypothetical protein